MKLGEHNYLNPYALLLQGPQSHINTAAQQRSLLRIACQELNVHRSKHFRQEPLPRIQPAQIPEGEVILPTRVKCAALVTLGEHNYLIQHLPLLCPPVLTTFRALQSIRFCIYLNQLDFLNFLSLPFFALLFFHQFFPNFLMNIFSIMLHNFPNFFPKCSMFFHISSSSLTLAAADSLVLEDLFVTITPYSSRRCHQQSPFRNHARSSIQSGRSAREALQVV